MSDPRETLLSVKGMTCMSCVRRVDLALRDLEGVRAVEVRIREGKVRVEHDPDEASLDAMVEALRRVGYEGTPSV